MKKIMETVEIDKKIASLKEEIEKLEKQKNDSYKKACDYWLGKYVTNGYGKFYIYDVEANDSGMASSFTKTLVDVADARGDNDGLMSYKVYTYAMAVPAAAGMTFKVTI